MRRAIGIACCSIALAAHGQPLKPRGGPGGTLSLGGRSAISLFNDGHGGAPGLGTGGQFRIRLSERVNTDWFYDYLAGPAGTGAHRIDQHIGWSALYYLRASRPAQPFFQPYVLAGHCFDYTRQRANNDPANQAERWSSAVQAGLGAHFNLTPRWDISTVVQYMSHLGTDVHAEEHDGEVHFHQEKGGSLEGHLLLHLSFNYKLLDAW
ncbi:MAG: hypothetical protein QY325_06285 [Flavobacteriales bacterium]|jgi:opacity protein-like surface antigen|nr:MAG: hypothetical protein QY325_06285 [Flavobacteriales bacterium]